MDIHNGLFVRCSNAPPEPGDLTGSLGTRCIPGSAIRCRDRMDGRGFCRSRGQTSLSSVWTLPLAK